MLVETNTVLKGLTPSYYVNVISHKYGSSRINLCYNNYISEPIQLQNGKYELVLSARAKPRTIHVRAMTITMCRPSAIMGHK